MISLSSSSSPLRVRLKHLNFIFEFSRSAVGWKRLFFADGPRQVINALTLYAIYLARKNDGTEWYNFKKYFAGNNLITTALTISTLFTVLIFAGSLLLLIIAAIFYVPLLCYIKGNLKVGFMYLAGDVYYTETSILGVLLPQS
jgi:hypothetical protein